LELGEGDVSEYCVWCKNTCAQRLNGIYGRKGKKEIRHKYSFEKGKKCRLLFLKLCDGGSSHQLGVGVSDFVCLFPHCFGFHVVDVIVLRGEELPDFGRKETKGEGKKKEGDEGGNET
jgi:hypothetical protein